MSSSRPTSPPPARPSPQRVFSPPPRVRSPPPLAPAPRVFSPTRNASPPPPVSRVMSPPPTLNILPSTPVQSYSSENQFPPLASSPITPVPLGDPPKIPVSKSLDAIHEVIETGEDGSESESGGLPKISSNSSSLILPPPSSPLQKPAKTDGDKSGGVDKIQPLEGNRSMTLEVTNKPSSERGLAPSTVEKDKDKAKGGEAALKRVKSNDTIKAPAQTKPPKKKRSRAANIANTNSSKAEIFAAKVAAVVDANPDSSDSEEAFVYDSTNNQTSNKRSGMHSRTPSMTSINSAYTSGNATYGTVPVRGGGKGSADESQYNFPTMTRTQGRTNQPKGYSSSEETRRRTILPDDSPFTFHANAGKQRGLTPQNSKGSLHPNRNSPRTKSTLPKSGGNTVKTPKWAQSQFYDGDDDDSYAPGVDSSNERVPLVSRDGNRSVRRFKGYKSRNRVPSGKQQAQISQNYERRRANMPRYNSYGATYSNGNVEGKCWPGLAGTAILVVTLLVLTMLTVGFVFQTSRSLENVFLKNVTNIVVSQEELSMDILVEAGNPNILAVVTGDKLAIDIFARSEYFDDKPPPSTDSLPFLPPFDKPSKKPNNNVTEGTSLLLGTIHELEAPLVFPPTSFKRISSTVQKSQMKLVGPAVNATDGPEKWKKAIVHNFELIVRGTMKYRAPIGGRERAVSLEWRGIVDPLGNRIWPTLEEEEE